jgi:hypothetical protein
MSFVEPTSEALSDVNIDFQNLPFPTSSIGILSSPPPESSPPSNIYNFLQPVPRVDDDADEMDESSDSELNEEWQDDDEELGQYEEGGVEDSIQYPRRLYTRRAAHRLSSTAKLNAITAQLREYKWSFQKFLRVWAGHNVKRQHILQSQSYRTVEQRRHILEEVMVELLRSKVCDIHLLTAAAIRQIIDELDTLIASSTYFGTLSVDEVTDPDRVESIDFQVASEHIKQYTPTWWNLLREILRNQRALKGGYDAPSTEKDGITRRSVALTAMVCFARAKQKSSFFATLLDVYFQGTGVKRRVVEVLSGMGLCHSYRHGVRRMGDLAEQSKV